VDIDAARDDLDQTQSGAWAGACEMAPCSPSFASLHRALVVAALCCLEACKPTLVVGDYQCSEVGVDGGPTSSDPIAVPWETGFENGPCDYTKVAGFCYRFPPISFRLVDQPVHSGQYAAEITVVTGTDGGDQPQGRCVRDGVLPVEAYYGAWYLLPKATTNKGLWNLIHFGSPDSTAQPSMWDVSLTNRTEGLSLELWSPFLPRSDARFSQPVPIGRWFHVVLYLKRAKDTTGAVALYLDDQKVAEFTNLITDDTDSSQWYVGNLASLTDPPECTVYLDDITIRSTL
jgi:hypothetical protein